MKQPQLSQFTPSTTHPFRPKRVFYIHEHPTSSSLFSALSPSPSSSSTTSEEKRPRIDVFEITQTALTSPGQELNLKAKLTDPTVKVHELTALVPKLEHLAREVETPYLTVQRGGWYHRYFEATRTIPGPGRTSSPSSSGANAEGNQPAAAENETAESESKKEVIARLDGPLLDMGHWKLTFPAPAEGQTDQEQRHEIELRPTGPGSSTDCFVMNSIPYIWEMVHGREVFRLWKCGMTSSGEGEENGNGNGKKGVRREVAAYIVRNARTAGKEGVLVLDDAEDAVDVVVAIMTCLGTVNRSDSFRK